MQTKVLLVDDHPTTRRGVALLLGKDPDWLVVGEASSGGEAMRLAALHQPDLVILDRHLPDADGLEVARRLLQLLPAIKVLFFSADGDLEGVNAALRAGAMGYVLKTGGDEELRLAIRFVTAGRLFVGPEVNACLLERYRQILTGQAGEAEHRLTGREREFLQLVAEGLRSKEIADRLKITAKSADTYRSRLMKKLGCGSTAELVRFALREGLAP